MFTLLSSAWVLDSAAEKWAFDADVELRHTTVVVVIACIRKREKEKGREREEERGSKGLFRGIESVVVLIYGPEHERNCGHI